MAGELATGIKRRAQDGGSGQVRVPFYGALTVPSRFGTKYQQGHYVEFGKHMIVSPGLGMSILPIRFNAVPEITLIMLVGKSPSH